jgi:hypothetical protein
MRRATRISPISAAKAKESAEYRRKAAWYLARHPYCQLVIFLLGLDEGAVINNRGLLAIEGRRVLVPPADDVHHRNKRCSERRLLDERFWISASRGVHDWVEAHKDLARELGLLLPIQADEDGRWGDGNVGLHTPELLARRAATVPTGKLADWLKSLSL